jgi:hypothetical protein
LHPFFSHCKVVKKVLFELTPDRRKIATLFINPLL